MNKRHAINAFATFLQEGPAYTAAVEGANPNGGATAVPFSSVKQALAN